MDGTMIQYRVGPEHQAENERLIKEVFKELRERAIEGVHYTALRMDDGTFVHLVRADPGSDTRAITTLSAFERFQSGIRERCDVLPVSRKVVVVGNYRMLADG
jgi:hypothetical protein